MEKGVEIRAVQIDEIRWFNVGAWYAVTLSRGLADLGHRVVFVAKENLPPGVEARNAGLKVHNDFTFKAWRFITEAKKLANIIKEMDANVICAHRAYGMNLALAARMMLPRPGPVVVRARFDARTVKPGIGNRTIYRNMIDGVVVPNNDSKTLHAEKLGISADRIRVIPGGVDTDLFRPDEEARSVRGEWGVPLDAPLVGLVARLDYVKGHDHFLEAAMIVARDFPQAYFAIIGEETNVKFADLKKRAHALGIAEKTVFVGVRPDVERCVAALDVGVVASTGSEALSRVALEYMACELPVVATKVGGIPDIVEEGVTGALVPPADSAAMAEAIKKLLSNPEKAKRMGLEGRKRAESVYSRQATGRKNAEFYIELIEQRRLKRQGT